MPFPLVAYNRTTTGIVSGENVEANHQLVNYEDIEDCVDSLFAAVDDLQKFQDAIEPGDGVRRIIGSITGGTNDLSIAANAVVIWDASAELEITGWPSKTLSSLTSGKDFLIWATFVAGVKDYEATDINAALPSNLNEKYCIGLASVSSSGAVTFTALPSTGYEQNSRVWKGLQYFVGDIYSNSTPVGAMMWWPGVSAPTGWLARNGAAISRTTYKRLFDLLVTQQGFTSETFTVTIASPGVFTKTSHGFLGGERLRLSTTGALPTGLNTTSDFFVQVINVNTFYLCADEYAENPIVTTGSQSGTHSYLRSLYGLGDGSTTFNLPDDRDKFIRASGSARAVGSSQNDDNKAHTHTLTGNYRTSSGATAFGGTGGTMGLGSVTDLSGGTESRPKNRAYLPIIKF